MRATAARSLPAIRILIVDADREIGRALTAMLIASGHDDIRSVRSAARAIAVAARYEPELAFIDVGLADMDAHDLARQLMRKAPSKSLRLIALTASIDHPGRETARDAGFERYLVKPVTRPEMDKILGLGRPS